MNIIQKKFLTTIAISLVLLFSGCGGDGGGSDTVTKTISGKVIDGYISDAQVCIDTNKNDICDINEPFGITDNNGKFSFTTTLNGDYPIITFNGKDMATNQPFDGVFKNIVNLGGDTSISIELKLTPLTTMMIDMIDKNTTKAQAKEILANNLDINISKIEADPMQDIKLFTKSQQIVQATRLLSKAILIDESNKTKKQKLFSHISKVIALSVKEDNTSKDINISKAITKLEQTQYGDDNTSITILNDIKTFTIGYVKEIKIKLDTSSVDANLSKIPKIQKQLDTFVRISKSKIENSAVADLDTILGKFTNIDLNTSNAKPMIINSFANIDENQTLAITIDAVDVDDNDTLTYSITSGADKELFSINSSTGVVTFITAPDYENPSDVDKNNTYNFTVQVSDGNNNITQAISIIVNNVNEFTPIINGTGSVTINKNQTLAINIDATDKDGNTLTYSIISGVDKELFDINSSTGAVTFKIAPDYENPSDEDKNNIYNFTVKVSDGEKDATKDISIIVNNTNEFAPIIHNTGNATIYENQTSVIDINATDEDGNTLTYSIITGIDSAKFNISTTGVITFKTAPDYESPSDVGSNNTYNFTVKVSDGEKNVTKAMSIVVANVNEVPTIGGTGSVTINENQTSAIVINATDIDSNTLTYSIIAGADSAKFDINSSTGVVTFITAPNYESPSDNGGNNTYNFTVKVSDGENNVTKIIIIVVSNVNEAPTIDGTGSVTINENQTSAIDINATDIDSNTLIYSIIAGVDSAKFDINSSTGVVTFITAPNYESPSDNGGNNTYNFTVKVSDGEKDATKDISINVNNVNDNTPIINTDSATINENQTLAIDINATDKDGNTLIYSIIAGVDSAKFDINSSTGVVTFITAPNYESPSDNGGNNTYNFTVKVSDGEKDATKDISINVNNVNDNTPIINTDSATINENQTLAIDINATDKDGNTLIYSIIAGVDSAKFDINSSTGVITFITAPNYESPSDNGGNNTYNFTVKVSDGEKDATKYISINVNNVNDNTPIIDDTDSATINENQTLAIDINATDKDGNTLIYSIIAGVDSAKFDINSSTGVVTFITAPNYESPSDNGGDNTYNFTVQVSDGEKDATKYISINVANVNDNTPIINTDSATINENQTLAIDINATDKDGNTLIYSIIVGVDSAKFDINSSTGVVTFITAPNYESPSDNGGNNTYNFTVKVSDGEKDATKDISINVANVNDNTPIIDDTDSATINENQTLAIDINATDKDGNTLIYSIIAGVDSAKFDINSSTGVVTFITAPNYESPSDNGGNNTYNFTVKVSDGEKDATKYISINVNNVNDNIPIIDDTDSATINENQTLAIDINATDKDGNTLIYSIIAGVDSAKFDINSSTGVVTFITAPNYESPSDNGGNNTYNFTVKVSDGEKDATKYISINVNNVNDNTPIINTDSATINENQTLAIDINATDKDGNTLIYSIIAGVDSAKFDINSSTGVVTFITAPNYESPSDNGGNNTYNFTVKVSDGEKDATKYISINVANVNDNTPIIDDTDSATINENQTSAIDINATDKDGNTLIYSIIAGADSAKFDINSSTGVITFITAPNYESPSDNGGNNTYNFTVKVSDGEKDATKYISINVANVNDNIPIIDDTDSATINENQTSAIDINATDKDGNTLIYSIIAGVDSAKFDINSSTGVITFITAPNYESPSDNGGNNTYNFTVKVSDGEKDATKYISINVNNVNDNTPIINTDSATINENQTLAIDINATDKDGNTLIYSIIAGVDSAKFDINSSTGVVTFITAPNYESPSDNGGNNTYNFTVKVSDGEKDATKYISINVANVNDNTPIIDDTDSATINENQTLAIDINATDKDGNTLIYSIIAGVDSAKFDINSSTGVVTFITAPNYESPSDNGGNNTYNFTVKVSDGEKDATKYISINVNNVNDNTPIINTDSATINENQTLAIDINATDKDGNTLIYSIIAGVDSAKFDINSSTGVVTFITAPNYESPSDNGGNNTYNFTVKVSDGEKDATKYISINVANVNDNTPIINTDSATINENQTLAINIDATDKDGNTLIYSIIAGVDSAKFDINSSTGVVTFITAPNYESPSDNGGNNTYNFTVKVSDGEKDATKYISINVNNVNEFAPTASDFNLTLDVDQQSITTNWLTSSNAQDGDSNTLTATISSNGTYGIFSISNDIITYTLSTETNTSDSASITISDGNYSKDINITINRFYWKQITAGENYTVAIKSDGTLWAWGKNDKGQLGDGTTTQKLIPTQIGIDKNWTTIGAGAKHTVALKKDGTLWAWGYNYYSQLGTGNTTDLHSPTQIGTDKNWTTIGAGGYHTLAISDGTLWAWGYNKFGQLGIGDNNNRNTPTQIGADNNWTTIEAGSYHTLAIKKNGTLWAWGDNGPGQLGVGDTDKRNTPTQIGTDKNWTTIKAGAGHTVALKKDGTLWTWGGNGHGQLGDGTTTEKHSPTQIGTDKNWTTIKAGGTHTLAISDGTLWAWGYNANGQLGTEDENSRNIPTQIGDYDNWTTIGAGSHHTVALKKDGTLWAWGSNSNSQLGDGSEHNSNVPINPITRQ